MFGQTTIIFLCVGLAIFFLANVIFTLRLRIRSFRAMSRDPFYIWTAGLGRYLTARQWRISRKLGYTLPLGQIIIVSVLIIFFSGESFSVAFSAALTSAMTLGPKVGIVLVPHCPPGPMI